MSDVVLTGERSGVDFARTAKSQYPDIAVLLITGYAPEGVPADQVVLAKPYTADALALAVHEVLAGQ